MSRWWYATEITTTGDGHHKGTGRARRRGVCARQRLGGSKDESRRRNRSEDAEPYGKAGAEEAEAKFGIDEQNAAIAEEELSKTAAAAAAAAAAARLFAFEEGEHRGEFISNGSCQWREHGRGVEPCY